MNYQGGSIVAGNELEKIHEITVKNNYALRGMKKRMEEIKTLEPELDQPLLIEHDSTNYSNNLEVQN